MECGGKVIFCHESYISVLLNIYSWFWKCTWDSL